MGAHRQVEGCLFYGVPWDSKTSKGWRLIPKGLNVPRVTKPDLVSVASPHNIFRFFETFCEDASRNKLRMSANFMILGAMVAKVMGSTIEKNSIFAY
jgi:hypothetical protein